LNPTDSKDMTSQLAQIQGLESQEQMNTKLDALVASINAGQSYSLVSAIGRYAKVEANQMTLDASGAAASVVADAGYQSIEVALRDAAGKLVVTNTFDSVPPGEMDFSWGGVDAAGNKLAYGTYNIAATGVSSNGTRVSLKVNPLVRVDGVVNDAGAWKLRLSDGKTVAQADVKGIY
jgi:flagellar basal-body rod modification protein FlgD